MAGEAPAGARLPLTFLIYVFALSLPFWWLGAFTDVTLLPGLPVSALMLVCPAIAAAILVYRENGPRATRELLKRPLDFHRIARKAWYLPTFLLFPAATLASYLILVAMGVQLPRWDMPIAILPVLALLCFIGAAAEEIGWTGYAVDRIQERTNALIAALVLGCVWAVWHLVPLVQAQRAPSWIAWWAVGTIANRVIIVWLYNNTGKSLFAAAVYHATINLGWQLFPNFGSHYDPRVASLIVACVAVIVVIVWGPRTFTRF